MILVQLAFYYFLWAMLVLLIGMGLVALALNFYNLYRYANERINLRKKPSRKNRKH